MSSSANPRSAVVAVALVLTAAAAFGGTWAAVLPLENGSCAVGHKMCLDGNGCVPSAQWCDGKPDCADETDEFSCGAPSSNERELEEAVASVAEAGAEVASPETLASGDACAPGEHRCLDGTCISKERICDGPRDCFDGSDEDVLAGCRGNSSTCEKDEFRCSDGSCIPITKTCDEHADCPDGGDELIACPTIDVPCHDGFRCVNDNKCIPLEWVCDGQEECRDGSDEGEQLCLNWVMPTRPATTPATRKKSSGSRREALADTPLATEAFDPCSRMAPEHQRICREDQVQFMKVEEMRLRQRTAQEQLEVAQQELAAAKKLAEEQLTAAQLRRQAAGELLKQQQELYNIKLQTLKQSLDKQDKTAIVQNVPEISMETNATVNDQEDIAV